jgi:hypothetical protein
LFTNKCLVSKECDLKPPQTMRDWFDMTMISYQC